MKLPFESIRWRIQAWHGVILLIAISAFCAAAYQLAWLDQKARIDLELQKHERQLIRRMSHQYEVEPVETVQNGGKRIPISEGLYQNLLKGGNNYVDVTEDFLGDAPGYYFYAFVDANGDILLKSENAPSTLEFLPVPKEVGMGEEIRLEGPLLKSLRSFDFGLRSIVGRDISTDLDEQHQFGWSLGISGFALWLFGLLGGWWLAGKAIRPIQSISQTVARIADGNLSERIRSTGNDSELDQLSHVLNDTFDRLNATLEQQRQFTSDASHELRTPLTILLSESQRMRKRQIVRSTEDYQAAFDSVHEAAERMRSLVESLLLLARQDSNPAEDQAVVDCDLAKLIDSSILQNRSLAESRNISVTFDLNAETLSRAPSGSPFGTLSGLPAKALSEGTCCSIKANPDLLMIVLNNLIGNAIQHHQGNGSVHVDLDQGVDEWMITIADDGPGISVEDLPRVFDRFYRVDRARSDSQAGHAGLGLALVKTIIESMGGVIVVRSELGKGSEFVVTFPSGA